MSQIESRPDLLQNNHKCMCMYVFCEKQSFPADEQSLTGILLYMYIIVDLQVRLEIRYIFTVHNTVQHT